MNYVEQTRRKMYKKEGYWDVTPKIKRLSFPKRGKFQVDLQDGELVFDGRWSNLGFLL